MTQEHIDAANKRKGERYELVEVTVKTTRKPFYEGDARQFADALERLCQQYGVKYDIEVLAVLGKEKAGRGLDKRTGKQGEA